MTGDDDDLDFDGEDFDDESISGLTPLAVDAHARGDKDAAAAFFESRDALARAQYPDERFPQTGPTSAAGGSGIEASWSWADVEEAAWEIPEGILLLEHWGPQAEMRVRKSLGFIMESDSLRERFDNASDVEKVDLIADAWELAKNAEPIELASTPRERDPSPTTRLQAQQALDAILAEHPPGSASYTTAPVQARVRNLHRIIAGDTPVVGHRLRSV